MHVEGGALGTNARKRRKIFGVEHRCDGDRCRGTPDQRVYRNKRVRCLHGSVLGHQDIERAGQGNFPTSRSLPARRLILLSS